VCARAQQAGGGKGDKEGGKGREKEGKRVRKAEKDSVFFF
jgi:hypothetical protein